MAEAITENNSIDISIILNRGKFHKIKLNQEILFSYVVANTWKISTKQIHRKVRTVNSRII